MYHNDPAAALHARHGESEAMIAIDALSILASRLPPRVLGLVLEWASEHQAELRVNWELARRNEPLCVIEPLR